MQSTVSSTDYSICIACDVYPLNIDWLKLANDMKERGVPYTKQASSIGKQWSTLQGWLNGRQPNFNHGQAFLVLHAKVCGMELTLKRLSESPQIE